MLVLLGLVVILGIVAWIVNSSPLDQFFKNVAFGIIAIIILVAFFRIVLGVSLTSALQ
jgi:hypothetical protein